MRHLTRDEAVARIRAERPNGGCLMCAIREAPERGAVVVREAGATLVIPRYQLRRGHVLVIADVHATSFVGVPRATWEGMSRLALEAARALERAIRPARCFVASLGVSREEDVPMSSAHLHLHVVPVDEGSLRPSAVFTWKSGVFTTEDEEREALRAEILAAWDDGPDAS